MSLKRSIAFNVIVQFIGKIGSTLLSLVTIAIMGRYLNTEQFGWYITTIGFLQFIGIVIDFGLVPLTAQLMSDPGNDKPTLIKNLLGFRMTTAFIFYGSAPLLALLFPYPPQIKIAIAFTSIMFMASAFNQVLYPLFQVKLVMHLTMIGEIFGKICALILLIAVVSSHAGFYYVMAALILGTCVYGGILWNYARRYYTLGFAFDLKVWRHIVKQSLPIAISIVFNVLYLRGDILILSWFRPQTEVALYGAAYRVIDVITQSAMLLMGILLPLLAQSWLSNKKEQFYSRFTQSYLLMLLFAVPISIGGYILAEPLITFIVGEKYVASAIPLMVLIIATIGIFAGALLGHTAVALNKQKQTMWVYISCSLITLTAYFLTIPRYGIMAAAWLTVFSELYVGIFLFLSIKKYLQTPFPFGITAKILASGIVMAFVLLVLPAFHVMIRVICGAVAYGVCILLMRVIDMDTIKQIIRKNPEQQVTPLV